MTMEFFCGEGSISLLGSRTDPRAPRPRGLKDVGHGPPGRFDAKI